MQHYHHVQTTQPLKEKAKHILYVRDFADLQRALVELYRKSGARSYQEIEDISAGTLSHSTVWRVMNETARPPSPEFVVAFAQACGLRGVELRQWRHAWHRAEERRTGGTPKNPVPSQRRRRQVATVMKKDGTDKLYYLDRGRDPGGEDVWTWREEVPQGTLQRHLEHAMRSGGSLSPAELEAARSLKRRLPRPQAIELSRASYAKRKLGRPPIPPEEGQRPRRSGARIIVRRTRTTSTPSAAWSR
ncbi:hypothetical protein QIS99_32040 [Streptomyces sp. B-S-A8]|uniref:HTH cro/C1-type domain-containing protein n=1 Tax=Streptomyces solicavernae TaxID=3043614 RepID=A0ABT6S285_9ACTN|nr:hypothetical protein [Streptomyces sp. B-S-A8]MDI3390785.1 hypothetical protein [Streptomyces sp. B-S-A8]